MKKKVKQMCQRYNNLSAQLYEIVILLSSSTQAIVQCLQFLNLKSVSNLYLPENLAIRLIEGMKRALLVSFKNKSVLCPRLALSMKSS